MTRPRARRIGDVQKRAAYGGRMELLTGRTRRETAVAWAFVAGQAVLLAVLVLAPTGDDWLAPRWLDRAALGLELLGAVALAVGLVGLGRSLTALPVPVPHGELRTSGIYRLVRHPIYAGILALAAGLAVRSGSLVVALAAASLTGWFMAKARWEEARLRDRYPAYLDYQRRTPRFVPAWPFGADRR
jgi:protein-S-isoprenylcysteine O-methyltransferase Ste14